MPVTRIEKRFEQLKSENRAGLVTFTTAGDPDIETSLGILKGLPGAGADIIELGMPFSDPMADGPAIQEASIRALKNKMTLAKTLKMVKEFRKDDQDTPIILMGYYNPVYICFVRAYLVDGRIALAHSVAVALLLYSYIGSTVNHARSQYSTYAG